MTPAIGDKGIYDIKDPYTLAINKNIEYTCIALRSITDYIVDGVDIFSQVYKAYGLSNDIYNEAIKKEEIIVTLQSRLGVKVMVPSDYIGKIPDPNGRTYRSMMMYVSLGTLPTNLKTGTLEQEVKDFISSKLGITPEVGTIENSEPYVISNDDHVLREQKRYKRITDGDSMTAKIKKLTEENESLSNLVQKLQHAILKLKTKN